MAYEAIPNPYCYRGTDVLKNVPGIRDGTVLQRFEAAVVLERGRQPIPRGTLSATHYRVIHRHLFHDVYRWAGRYRTVRLSKGGSVFCYPENISGQMRNLFRDLAAADVLAERPAEEFSLGAAHFLAELNAIHPIREGNGRSQNTFLGLLAVRAGHRLDFAAIDPPEFLDAMVASFGGDESPLRAAIRSMIE